MIEPAGLAAVWANGLIRRSRCAAAYQPRARAVNINRKQRSTTMFDQSARLNLVYHVEGYERSYAPSIQVEFMWMNRQGAVIARSLQTVLPGQGAFSDINLNYADRSLVIEARPTWNPSQQ